MDKSSSKSQPSHEEEPAWRRPSQETWLQGGPLQNDDSHILGVVLLAFFFPLKQKTKTLPSKILKILLNLKSSLSKAAFISLNSWATCNYTLNEKKKNQSLVFQQSSVSFLFSLLQPPLHMQCFGKCKCYGIDSWGESLKKFFSFKQ